MTIDQAVNFDGTTPQEVTTADITLMGQVKMIGKPEILPLSEQKS